MSKTSTQSLSRKKSPSKLVMGLMVAAVSVLVGTAGIASATPGNGNAYGHEIGRGHSISNGNHNGHDHGDTGYGGGVNVNLGDMLGDNNIIVVIINYFTGNGS